MKWAFTRFLIQKYSHTQKSVERNSVKIVFISIPAPHFHLFIPRVSRFCHHAEKKFCLTINVGMQSHFPSSLWAQLSSSVHRIHAQSVVFWQYRLPDIPAFQSFSVATQRYITQSWHLTYFCFICMNLQKVENPIIFHFNQENIFFMTFAAQKCQTNKQWSGQSVVVSLVDHQGLTNIPLLRTAG